MNYEKNRNFKGIFIPKEVWFDTQLKITQKIFMIEIDSLDNDKKRGCYASNKYFSDFFNLSTVRCSQILKELKELKLIDIVYQYKGKEIVERNMHLTNGGIKYIKGGIKKTLKRYNNNNNSIINNTERKSKDFPKNDLIEYWNSLGLRQHNNPNTKVYQNIAKKFKRLKAGTFSKFYELDREFINKNKISNNTLATKWTEEMIKVVLKDLALLFKEGYWPQNKDLIPKDLDSLIFNPRTGYSWFFKVIACPPKKYSDQLTAKPIDSGIFEKYRTLFNGQIKTPKQENNLILSVNDIIQEVDKIYKKVEKLYSHTSFSSHLGSSRKPVKFFDEHIKFLKTRKKLHPNFVGISTFTWGNFIEQVQDNHGYKLDPTKTELRSLKRECELAERRQGKR